jgi:SAM-dependent methyltransferase
MDEKLHQTYRRIEKTHWWFVGRRQLALDFLEKQKPGADILDFGCNAGFLVDFLRQRGWRTQGCDKSADAIAFGRAQGITDLRVSDTDSLPFSDEQFDAVFCLDVLEHLADDRIGMAEIRRILKPGGQALITVPAFKFLWGLQDKVSHHFRRYRLKDLKNLAGQKGLKIKRASYFNFFLFLPIALARFWQKISKPRRISDFELNNSFINWLFKTIFLGEIKLLRHFYFPWGVSIFIVLQK